MRLSPKLIAVLLTAAAVVAGLFGIQKLLPLQDYFTSFLNWVRELGPWGPAILGAAYVPASVFMLPAFPLTLGAGFLFDLVPAVVAVSIGSTCGAAAAFLVGRFLARGWVEARVAGSPKFRALDQAVADQGFKIVFLTRLSPAFPFNLLNYTYGLTKVRFRDYVIASWIGMLPGTIMYVYLGRAAGNLAQVIGGQTEDNVGKQVLFVVGLLATVAVTVYVTRIARRALAAALPSAGEGAKTIEMTGGAKPPASALPHEESRGRDEAAPG